MKIVRVSFKSYHLKEKRRKILCPKEMMNVHQTDCDNHFTMSGKSWCCFLNLSNARTCAQLPSHVQLCDPMDQSPMGSSVLGISQARVIEWVAISFSKGSSLPREWHCISCISHMASLPVHHLGSLCLCHNKTGRKSNNNKKETLSSLGTFLKV